MMNVMYPHSRYHLLSHIFSLLALGVRSPEPAQIWERRIGTSPFRRFNRPRRRCVCPVWGSKDP